MDRITEALLNEFSASFGIASEKEPDRFERFAAYLATRRHYSEATFDPGDIVTGAGGDTGVDAIAIIVNNNVVTDVSEVDDLIEANGYLDVTFVFTQAETSSNFDMQKIGHFGYGVSDFFGDAKLPKNDSVLNFLSIMLYIYKNSSRFTRGNPSCYLYYITTGTWTNDTNLVTRSKAVEEDLTKTRLFSRVEFKSIGADEIQKLYNQTKNKIQREFEFARRNVVSGIGGVKEAHLGYMVATDFLKLICDEQDEIIESLFYENVRGWHGYNQINSEIKDTLSGDGKDRFVLMNNGVTIISREMRVTADHFTISDFQVVNGCQTSHVLYDNKDLLDDKVRIPIRIISTQDDDVMESIITATNRQTEVKQDQFFALRNFSKKLEAFFKAFSEDKALYYERRAHQYDSHPVEKTKIVGHQSLVRAVGAIILQEPHRTTRTYRLLAQQVGKDIFVDGDKLEPYYISAYALYRLEFLFRSRKIATKLKPARYLILLAAILKLDNKPLRPLNSNDVQKRANRIMEQLWKDGDAILVEAAEIVAKAVGDANDRDAVRTEGATDAVLKAFGVVRAGPAKE
ncbi:AIPR family protein [Bosea sp. LjRoot90]|uniref:AIPR family protein n=1 Tax=Bosea sp. LjRoot90 TaxID=3342342 RepID=UPI003ECD8AE8